MNPHMDRSQADNSTIIVTAGNLEKHPGYFTHGLYRPP